MIRATRALARGRTTALRPAEGLDVRSFPLPTADLLTDAIWTPPDDSLRENQFGSSMYGGGGSEYNCACPYLLHDSIVGSGH
jgi:hypothetical protein